MTLRASFLVSISFFLFMCNKKADPAPAPAKGSIAFWVSYDKSCHTPITVTIDGVKSGEISNWQAIAAQSCAQSNSLLVVPTTQGNKTVTFAVGSCFNKTVTINLTSDCYVYQVW